MHKIFLRWLTAVIPVLFIVTTVVFVLSSFVPGDAGRTILGANASPEQVAALNEQLGFNRPLIDRYLSWLFSALHGDLGVSITSGVSVADQIGARAAVTASLVAGAVLVAGVLGLTLGLVSAVRGGVAGRLVDLVAVLGIAVPNFWLALVLVSLFAVRLHLFPATGYVSFADSPFLWFQSLVLPALTLGLPAAAPVAKQTRDGVLTQLGLDYVRVLRARGIPESAILFRHVLRNAATPIITVLGIVAVVLLGGTVLVESVFVLPGLGGLAVTASGSQDIPTVQGVAVVFTLVVMVVNLLIELLYAIVDPKIRTT